MTDKPNIEMLSDGLSSPFWAWFKSYVEAEWGASGERYQQAVQNAAAMKDENAVHTLRMVIFAHQEIIRLLHAPDEKLSAIRQIKKLEHRLGPVSRRGPGL